jgi:glucose-6-phosphate isomerase
MTETTWPAEAARAPVGMRLPADLATAVDDALGRAVTDRWAGRIWERDAGLWTGDEVVAATIAERLGWLDAPVTFAARIEELEAFAAGVRSEGFTAAVVCGMGGSSLAPEVLARAYLRGERGVPVAVLDSTDPAAVAATREATDATTTLYLIATKSGTTIETLSFLAYLWELQDELHDSIPDSRPGEHFVAITDPGRSVEAIPHTEAFRSVFLNPPEVGGRYSALTCVGLVPAALLDLDMRGLLREAASAADASRSDGTANPALALGIALGALARAGRDKMTLVLEPELAAFGAWVEQLVAESTGKQGTGIVPVDGEPLGPPAVYADDRVFVRLGREDATDWRSETDGRLDALAAAGHPVLDLTLPAGSGLGGECFRWEFATAVAGAVLGVNPFDEPNVTESKDNTKRVLAQARESGRLPVPEPLSSSGPLELIGDAPLRLTQGPADLPGQLARHLARPASYVAIQAYFAPSPSRDALLAELRVMLRDRTRRATTVGYGPRFLHSTGQLHKGGPRSGCFVQLTCGHREDLPIPDSDETFGRLIDAQALGDFAALESHELPVVRIHLGDDPEAGLHELLRSVAAALPQAG